jgi:hypothetical protein
MFEVLGRYKGKVVQVKWESGEIEAWMKSGNKLLYNDILIKSLVEASEQGTYGNVQTKFFRGKDVLKSALGTWLFLSDTLEDMKLVEGEQPLWPDIPNGVVA